jgi:hypothetical protein
VGDISSGPRSAGRAEIIGGNKTDQFGTDRSRAAAKTKKRGAEGEKKATSPDEKQVNEE